jgi:hypothetical protein
VGLLPWFIVEWKFCGPLIDGIEDIRAFAAITSAVPLLRRSFADATAWFLLQVTCVI